MLNKILFVTYGGGHAKMLLPVIQKLQGNPRIECLILALTTAKAYFDTNLIKTFGFKDLLSHYSDDEITQIEHYGKSLAQDNGVIAYDESLSYMGISYLELVKELGEKAAKIKYEQQGRAAFLPVNALTRLLKATEANLLVTTVSPRAEQASIMAAKQLGIPTICINDFINKNSAQRIAETKPDITCVVSEGVKKQIKDLNYDGRLEITGNPAFDRLFDLNQNDDNLKSRIGINIKLPTILWAAQREHGVHPFTGENGDTDLPRKIEQVLISIAAKNKFNIILRSHPNDFVDYNEFSDVINGNGYALDELLSVCDAVFTISSTVGYEALLLGKKLLTFDGSTLNSDGPYSEVNMSESVNNLSDIESSLISLFSDNGKCRVEDSVLGLGTANVIKLIDEVLFE